MPPRIDVDKILKILFTIYNHKQVTLYKSAPLAHTNLPVSNVANINIRMRFLSVCAYVCEWDV